MHRSKLFYLGFLFLLLILYVVWVPSPSVNKIYMQGDLGYLIGGYGFTILKLTPRDQIAHLSSVYFAYTIKDLAITPSYAYVITNDGIVHIMDIGNPWDPKKVVEFSTTGVPKYLAVNGATIYIADQAGSVRILDVNIPTIPFEKGSIVDLGVVLDVDVIGNLVYIARGNQGLDIYDTSNPAEPKRLGQYDAGGSIGQVAVHKITAANGNETIRATLIVGKRAVQLVDVTNIQQPILLNSFDFGATKIEQALITDKRLFVAQGRAGLLISSIKNNGELERLVNINTPRNTFGVALQDTTVYLATGWEGLQVFDISKLDNIYSVGKGYSKFWDHKKLIVFSTFVFLFAWLAFFAQFVLPVRTISHRYKIFVHLIIFLVGKHGPAIFVKDGKAEPPGEIEKKGPGVVWLDTASAAAIRTATKFKGAIGPGVHFTKKRETLAGPLDLHTQVDSLGPKEEENPFDKQTDDQSNEVYREIQNRRKMTSALTRDGIEVVPSIRVVFRVNTQPAQGDESGSRFGYRTGIRLIDKENEDQDKEAIFNAITGEGIDPTTPEDTPRHRIAWNQLPGRLAADVWREYVAKFTLDELFAPTQEPSLESHPLPEPEPEDIEAIKHPIHVSASRQTYQNGIADMLRIINHYIADLADWIEGKKVKKVGTPSVNIAPNRRSAVRENFEIPKQTALQVINEMVKKRLTQPEVEVLDNTGIPIKRTTHSEEFDLLCERGLKVLSVSISDLRFKELVEKHLIDQWKANWYSNAKTERERIERRRRYVEIKGEEDGANEYVHALARHIMLQRPRSIAEALRTLLMRTRLTIVRSDQLQYRMSTERQDIEDLLQWVENNS